MAKSKTKLVRITREAELKRKIVKKAMELALKEGNPAAKKARKYLRLYKKYLRKAIQPYLARARAIVLQKEKEG